MVLEITRTNNKITLLEIVQFEEVEEGVVYTNTCNEIEAINFIADDVKELVVYVENRKWIIDNDYIQHIKETYEKRGTVEAR